MSRNVYRYGRTNRSRLSGKSEITFSTSKVPRYGYAQGKVDQKMISQLSGHFAASHQSWKGKGKQSKLNSPSLSLWGYDMPSFKMAKAPGKTSAYLEMIKKAYGPVEEPPQELTDAIMEQAAKIMTQGGQPATIFIPAEVAKLWGIQYDEEKPPPLWEQMEFSFVEELHV